MISARIISPRGRDGRFNRLADRPEHHDARFCHRAIGAEAGDELRHYLADQSGAVVLIGVARHGLGIIAPPFTFHRPFHGGQYDE